MTRTKPVNRLITLLMLVGCSPTGGDRPPPASESAAAPATGTADASPIPAGVGGAQATECLRPEGTLARDATLEGRAGDYKLIMVEEVDGSPARRADGSLALFAQLDSFRRFAGSAGATIPGVASPLFGSTDLGVERVGAVRVGDLSSEDPAAPGVLVIESETGSTPSILLRFGSYANRRDIVRFDGGYTVLTVVEITAEAFGGIWSSGVRGQDSEGFFCATGSR